MTPGQVRASLATGEARPIYLLESDDAPSRHDLAHAFLELVDDDLHAFNVATFHGRDATNAGDREAMISAMVSAARTLPMMAPRRVILLHDADVLLTPRRAKDEAAPEPALPPGKKRVRALSPMEELEAYVAAPESLTTLVLDAPSLDRGRRISKLLLQHAVVVDCGTLETLDDAARWIRARLERDEMTMEPAAVRALVDATGLSLSRVRGEVEKLALYAGGGGSISIAHVRDVVAPTEEPGEDFALGKAIWNGQVAAALREVDALMGSGLPAPMVLGQVRAAVLRLRPEGRAKAALRAVLDADLAVKSSRGEPRYVLERLVVEVCGGGGAPTYGGPPTRSWA